MSFTWGKGLYGTGMHDFVMTELELGTRAAHAIDDADSRPLGWLEDIHYFEDMQRERRFQMHFYWGALINRPQDLIRVVGI